MCLIKFRSLKIEHRSSSNFQRSGLYISSKLNFIDQKEARFAICVVDDLSNPSKHCLCILEIDLNREKLIIHQLYELDLDGKNRI
jgi:hypothetical protein